MCVHILTHAYIHTYIHTRSLVLFVSDWRKFSSLNCHYNISFATIIFSQDSNFSVMCIWSYN